MKRELKKQIISSSIISFAILAGSFATIAINNAKAIDPTNDEPFKVETSELIKNEPIKTTPKNETIYAITKSNGDIEKSYINSTINKTGESLPVDVKITYYLNGKEVKPEELASSTGHIRIVYKYSSNKTYGDKKVPFIAITGLMLDKNIFSNIKIDNGKIISEDRGIVIAGYSLVGLNEDFGVDFLPDSFAFEADAKDFALDTVYTLITNEIFSDIDTSKLTSIDELIGKINQLSSGLNQIIDGATNLYDGLGQLFDGLSSLKENIDLITNKVLSITVEAEKIIDEFNEKLNTVRQSLADFKISTPETLIATIKTKLEEEGYDLPDSFYELIKTIIEDDYEDNRDKIVALAEQIDTIVENNFSTVSSFVSKVQNGAIELKYGVSALNDGAAQLHDGAGQLRNGLITYKSQGIDRIVDFANNDINNFVLNLRKTVTAAASYRSYSNSGAKSVKFVFKTPSIK